MQNFTNNFQSAKDALSAATAQAAEKAASSVRDFAQKSFRLTMDIKLKAPLIIIPQSSTSHDALVMDLGLITVGNSFSLLPIAGCPLPAVIDSMDVQLTKLKLSRSVSLNLEDPDEAQCRLSFLKPNINLCFLLTTRIYMDPDSEGPSTELLEPVNLQLNIKRNLAASWYKGMATVEIDGDLKPMKVREEED